MDRKQQQINSLAPTSFPAVVITRKKKMFIQKAASQLAMLAGLFSLHYYVNATRCDHIVTILVLQTSGKYETTLGLAFCLTVLSSHSSSPYIIQLCLTFPAWLSPFHALCSKANLNLCRYYLIAQKRKPSLLQQSV